MTELDVDVTTIGFFILQLQLLKIKLWYDYAHLCTFSFSPTQLEQGICNRRQWLWQIKLRITAAPPPQKNSMAFICEFGNCRKKWKALGTRFHTPIRGVTFESKGALLEIFQGSDDDRVLIDENVNLFVDSI